MDTDVHRQNKETPFKATKNGRLLPYLKGSHHSIVTQIFVENSGEIGLNEYFDFVKQSHLVNKAIDVILHDGSEYYSSLNESEKEYHLIIISRNLAVLFGYVTTQATKIVFNHLTKSSEYINKQLMIQVLLQMDLTSCVEIINSYFEGMRAMNRDWYTLLLTKFGNRDSLIKLFVGLREELQHYLQFKDQAKGVEIADSIRVFVSAITELSKTYQPTSSQHLLMIKINDLGIYIPEINSYLEKYYGIQ